MDKMIYILLNNTNEEKANKRNLFKMIAQHDTNAM